MTLAEQPLVLVAELLGLLGALILVVGLLAIGAAWALVRWYDRQLRER